MKIRERFYILDLSRLPEFGFSLNDKGNYSLTTHRYPCMNVDPNTRLILFTSLTRSAIATLCEMSKAGIVEVVRDPEEATHYINVTSDELRVIEEMRKKEGGE